MNREDTKVVPFRTAASPYNAEIEKKRNVIGQQLAKAVRDCGYSKKAFCEVLKNYGVDVTHSALGKWTNGLTVPSAYQLVAICHALHIEEGISYFTGSYVSELNEVGMAKMRSYRDDLIASGRYRPQSKDDNHGKYVERPHVPLFILIELWIGFSKYDLTKTQSRIMPGVSKLAALLKRLLREVNYTA